MQELVAGVHVHDNHGEKDERLAPSRRDDRLDRGDRAERRPPANDVPLTLELKEKTAPDAPTAAEQLEAAQGNRPV